MRDAAASSASTGLTRRVQRARAASGISVVDSGDTRALRMWVDGAGNGRISHRVGGNGNLIVNDGGGFVGIGQLSPSAPLDVQGPGANTNTLNVTASAPSNVPVGYVEGDTIDPLTGALQAVNIGNGPGIVATTNGTGASSAFVAQRQNVNGDIARFVVGTTVMAHVDADGIGHFEGGVSTGGGLVSGSVQLAITGDATKPGGGSWSVPSDARLKKDIRELSGALNDLLALRGTTYEYRDPNDPRLIDGEQIGFIAQEVERVFPQWVGVDDDGYRMLTIRGFEALTVEALRELRREKDAEIAALNDRIERLEAMVSLMLAKKEGR